jgi:lipopolysaccharide/colanic/teichoic acid biosynthesis glycosyltransferase
MMIADIVAIFVSFALTGYVYLAEHGTELSLVLAQLLLPVYLTLALYNGAYSMDTLARPGLSVTRGLTALLVSALGVVFIAFYTKSSGQFSRVHFTLGVLLTGLAMAWGRVQMRAFVRWRCGASVINELVIDDGGPKVDLPGAYHVSAQSFGLKPSLNDPHSLDRIGLVMRHADRVIVSSPPERRADWSIILKGAAVAGEVIDEAVARLSAQGARRAGGQGLLQVSIGPLGMRSRVLKRMFDMVAAGFALLMISPLLVVVALAIKLDDGGPVFFVQRRVGCGNRFFAMYKFRSMTVNQVGQDGHQSASKTDSRVTRVGRLIRSTSIDELPQLINVLKGDMSLVGPRPHAIGSQAGDKLFWEVDTRYWQRHALKPGLTGLAQIRGWRGATDCEADLLGRLDADLEYLDGWSLWRDMRIIFSTFSVLVHDRAF